ncbi:MAG: hypothetical protein HAW67_00205 [Endozoicomonadaceae bacterium]|nr:hypothetical protein [Endozoicomonadaceae bacterium]
MQFSNDINDMLIANGYGELIRNEKGNLAVAYNVEQRNGIDFVANTQIPLDSIEEITGDINMVQEYKSIVSDLTTGLNVVPYRHDVKVAQIEGFKLKEKASVNIEGSTASTESGDYAATQNIPLYVTSKDVRFNFRDIAYARQAKMDEAMRVMDNTLETLFLYGTKGTGDNKLGGGAIKLGNNDPMQLDGFTNAAQTDTGTYSLGTNNEALFTNFNNELETALGNGYSNFYVIFASKMKARLEDNYTVQYGKTLRERIESHADIQKVGFSKALPENSFLAVSMGSNASSIISSIPMMVLPVPAGNTGFSNTLKFVTSMVPVVRKNLVDGTSNDIVSGSIFRTAS